MSSTVITWVHWNVINRSYSRGNKAHVSCGSSNSEFVVSYIGGCLCVCRSVSSKGVGISSGLSSISSGIGSDSSILGSISISTSRRFSSVSCSVRSDSSIQSGVSISTCSRFSSVSGSVSQQGRQRQQ